MLRTLFAQQQIQPPPPPPPFNHEIPPDNDQADPRRFNPRGVRLEFPHFQGVNPAAWLFKVNHYFEFHQTPLPQRLLMASYHMEGDALVWFQNAADGGLCRDWDTFSRSLLLRFGATAYDDPMEALTRLKQTSSVASYMAQFETLSNRLRGLSDLHKLSCFLSGLKDELRIPVRMLNPVNLNVAYGLAKMQEEYHSSTRKYSKPTEERTMPMAGGNSGQHSYSNDNYNKWKKPMSFTKPVTSMHMDEKRKKSLCFHCDEKWNPTHTCKNPRIYFLQVDEEGGEMEEEEPCEKKEEPKPLELATSDNAELEISLAAIAGTPTVRTMRLIGSINGEQVVILLDSGSSHNFIDSTMASKLKLPVDYLVNLKVRVANGEGLNSEGLCRSVKLKVQGNLLQLPLHLLDLAGCDIVLGVQWLETLGPITWDFSKLVMSFWLDGKAIELKGLKLNPSVVEEGGKVCKATMVKGKGIFLQIMCVGEVNQEHGKLAEPFPALLVDFKEVFEEPQGLPPPRSHDHHIVLK
ncbi:hypothetical protein F2P56_011555 [Juglans regia]|uniref:Retrotransposon gag domain-containing protein n=1 Tax=Juglans regia TaxID=51240 RepID=A0A833XQ03_JUGRE|nr:hypothetical protein F2P56_011555 [Juglans regia]